MDRKDFLPAFDHEFAGRLAFRAPSFRLMIDCLQARAKNSYFILETGCMRSDDNWAGDGMSTRLFDAFVGFHDGKVLSMDINPDNVAMARKHCSERTEVICGDSVSTLHRLSRQGTLPEIDLLYLDSYDFDKVNPLPSMFHHMKELTSIMPSLSPGTLVCVDDNLMIDGRLIGKGTMVDLFMRDIGAERLFEGYQLVWRL